MVRESSRVQVGVCSWLAFLCLPDLPADRQPLSQHAFHPCCASAVAGAAASALQQEPPSPTTSRCWARRRDAAGWWRDSGKRGRPIVAAHHAVALHIGRCVKRAVSDVAVVKLYLMSLIFLNIAILMSGGM